MRLFLFLLALTFSQFAHPQKVVSKSVEFPAGSVARIDARQCYVLQLDTRAGGEMVVEARMEGEYGGYNAIQLTREGNTLHLAAGFEPLFRKPNDKLGAHKVVSISLKILVPENRTVEILADDAQLEVHGLYEHLQILQASGYCGVYDAGRYVEIRTQTADILVASHAADIVANSRYGRVAPNGIPPGEAHFELYTISGNINLIRTE